jgi:hypothetical protein
MKDTNTKKELQSQYKEREVTGGVYIIKNTLKNKLLCEVAIELNSARNRFEFSQKTGSCASLKLQKDWVEQGSGQFTFEVLEELKKGDTQTDAEFKADLELLREMWLEKLSGEEMY